MDKATFHQAHSPALSRGLQLNRNVDVAPGLVSGWNDDTEDPGPRPGNE
ncbi:MAG: hypothetical protein JKY99_08755 [Rhizobiales bacterium]|nr:hypothetical protein [Hyphomicrobiales bacterium]